MIKGKPSVSSTSRGTKYDCLKGYTPTHSILGGESLEPSMDGLLYLDYLLITWTPVQLPSNHLDTSGNADRTDKERAPTLQGSGTEASSQKHLHLKHSLPAAERTGTNLSPVCWDGDSHGHHQHQKLCFLLFLSRSLVKTETS